MYMPAAGSNQYVDMSNEETRTTNRRRVLQLATLAGGLGMVPSGTAASGTPNGSASRRSTDGVVLGDFESDLDGWTTTGGIDLTRVNEAAFPAGVTNGDYGLVVEVNGDAYPMIENSRRVRNADFVNNPYLRMDVFTVVEETDSELVFTFRLHHTAGGGRGGSGGGSSQSKDVQVEESGEKTVTQLRPQTVQWDLTEVSDAALRTAKRLEIVWYLADHEPADGHRGKSNGEFEYRGMVVFDDIRLAASPQISESDLITRKKVELHRDHGMVVDRVIEQWSADSGRGTLVFADGYEAAYRFEQFDDGGSRYTLDGETFELESGTDE